MMSARKGALPQQLSDLLCDLQGSYAISGTSRMEPALCSLIPPEGRPTTGVLFGSALYAAG